MEWFVLIVAVLSAGLYFFHYLPSVRRQHLQQLTACLVKIGGHSDEKWNRILVENKHYIAAKKEVYIQLLIQLVNNELRARSEVLSRKKKQSVYVDDYGMMRTDHWLKEVKYFVKNVLFPLDTSELDEFEEEFQSSFTYLTFSDVNNKETLEFWTDFVDEYVDFDFTTITPDFDEFMTGHEYEEYIANLIRELGWSAKVTPGSGDHGADVIAERDGVKIAIQCKLYSSPVSNKSVQEAFSAKSFYDCDDACVVTNSSFTLAAKKAASKLGIALLHHEDIAAYFTD